MKRIILLMMMFIMLFSVTSLAAEPDNEDTNEITIEDTSIQPRYTYISFISAGLKIDENGYIQYSCSTGSLGRNVRMKLYLQRSRNQLFWEDIIGTIKTVYESGKISESYTVQADDYFYRAKVVVEVLDENKNIIESETAYSDSQRY